MKSFISLLACAALCACVATRVRDEVAMSHQAAHGFETMKQLVGQWSGTARAGEESWPVTISYRMTSGGSALLEDMYEESELEMLTLYHLDGADLRLTHYCAAGNQPSMVLAGASETPERILTFEFDRGTNMSPRDGHMHRATYTFVGPDHVIATWAYFVDGELDHETHFDLMREGTPGAR